jgi:hypothetical protein
LFGPVVDVPDHEVAFSVYFNIEDEGRTKEELRDILERKVKLLGRKKEILNGELI